MKVQCTLCGLRIHRLTCDAGKAIQQRTRSAIFRLFQSLLLSFHNS